MNDTTPTQTFNDLLPSCCADLREYTQTLYHSYGGASLGIEADDLFNDVIAKLAKRNYPVKSRGYLFGLVKQVTIHWMSDLRRKRNFREQFMTLPPPTWESSLGEDWIETLPSMAASPCEQVDLSDIIQEIGKAAEEDPKLALLFRVFIYLTHKLSVTIPEEEFTGILQLLQIIVSQNNFCLGIFNPSHVNFLRRNIPRFTLKKGRVFGGLVWSSNSRKATASSS